MKLKNLSRTTGEKLQAPAVNYTATEQPRFTTSNLPRQKTERIMYAIAGGVLFLIMLVGFQQFYSHGKAFPDHPIFPPLKSLIIAHGFAMTCWMTLFVVQTLLIVGNRFRTHVMFGIFGIAVAAAVVVFGSLTAIETTRLEPDLIRQGLNRKQFMIVPLTDMLKFGAFVIIAIWNRRRPEIHRPMMFLATLTMISAATGRIPQINDLYVATVWSHWFGAFFPKLVIGTSFLVVKTIVTKRFDGWLAGGLAVLAAISFLVWQIAPTAGWNRIANFLLN